MKQYCSLAVIVILLASMAAFAQQSPMPELVANARFIYVTTYDGPYWSKNVLPDDRNAVTNLEAALRSWGKYIVVLHPAQADIIMVVQKRPTEDTMAIYDNRPRVSSIPLWRAMQDGGLDGKEPRLLNSFRKAVENSGKLQARDPA